MLNFIRWILILPASILALILSSFILKNILPFIWQEDFNTDNLFYQCLIGIAGTIAFIYVGLFVAPKKNRYVLISLALLSITIQLILIFPFVENIGGSLKNISWDFWNNYGLILIFRSLLSSLTAIYFFFALKEDYSSNRGYTNPFENYSESKINGDDYEDEFAAIDEIMNKHKNEQNEN